MAKYQTAILICIIALGMAAVIGSHAQGPTTINQGFSSNSDVLEQQNSQQTSNGRVERNDAPSDDQRDGFWTSGTAALRSHFEEAQRISEQRQEQERALRHQEREESWALSHEILHWLESSTSEGESSKMGTQTNPEVVEQAYGNEDRKNVNDCREPESRALPGASESAKQAYQNKRREKDRRYRERLKITMMESPEFAEARRVQGRGYEKRYQERTLALSLKNPEAAEALLNKRRENDRRYRERLRKELEQNPTLAEARRKKSRENEKRYRERVKLEIS